MATPSEIAALRDYLGAGGASTFDDRFLATCWDRAAALVSRHTTDAPDAIPVAILEGAVVGVASEIFHAQSAPNGISQFADGSGNPIRVARDPMVAAYKILAPFVGLGIG